jgi:hypothetical protein
MDGERPVCLSISSARSSNAGHATTAVRSLSEVMPHICVRARPEPGHTQRFGQAEGEEVVTPDMLADPFYPPYNHPTSSKAQGANR